ncbi:MAG: InlB B-repeat-containing protein [Bacilli bacterium]|nr:InlB B-repeat-containing protein [Bacilli bacterium]
MKKTRLLLLGLALSLSTSYAISSTFNPIIQNHQNVLHASGDEVRAFDAISGDYDSVIEFEARKGNAGTAPAVNSDQIRVYQNGGLFEVRVKEAQQNYYQITSVTLGSGMKTKVTYSIDGATASSDNDISSGGTLLVNDLSCDSILFTCTGTTKNDRLYVNYLKVTYTATSTTSYTVTFYNGENVFDTADVIEGTTVSEPVSVPTKPSDSTYNYHFEAWCTDSELNNEYDFSTPVTGDLDLYARFVGVKLEEDIAKSYDTKASLSYKYEKEGSKISDTLNRGKTGVTGTTYTSWSNKKDESDAVYAGQSAGGNEAIQLRSNNSNSGIITTTSGGKAKKVTVVWNDNTDEGRTLDIYGKNTAYTSPTELYNSNNKGTSLGSIVKGTSTELTITGDYSYIGLRSSSGAMYIDSITIEWSTESINITEAGIRFGGLVDKDVFDALDVDGYGVMVGTTANVESVDTGVNSLQEAYETAFALFDDEAQTLSYLSENKITNVYASGKSPAIATDAQKAELAEGDYYLWNIYVNIPSSTYYKTNISAVAYIKVDGEYFFMQEKKITLVQLANDYLETDSYDANSFEGSLYYLANHNWGN